jgi:hypothetical protein
MSWRSMMAAGALAMGVAAAPASATIVYSNMAQQANPLLATVGVAGSGPLGNQFVTDAFSVGVSNIELLLKGDTNSLGSFVVTIVADAGNTPDLINPVIFTATVDDADLTTSGSYLTWDSGTIFAPVSANTAYWVMLTDASSTSVEWTYADNDSSGTPGNIASLYNYFGGGAVLNEGWPFVMQIECVGLSEGPCGSAITDVPEPATIGLLGAGMVALGVAIRRRRNMAA